MVRVDSCSCDAMANNKTSVMMKSMERAIIIASPGTF
jgi:hypothetical protein